MHTSHSLYSTCSYYHLVNCCSPSYTIHIYIYVHAQELPEDEDKQHKQHAEGGHIVHRLHQNHKLPPQRRHESHQLNDPQKPECPQHRQTTVCLANDLTHTGVSAHVFKKEG